MTGEVEVSVTHPVRAVRTERDAGGTERNTRSVPSWPRATVVVSSLIYPGGASRDTVAKLRLGGAPTPRSWVARMTKRPAPTGAGKSASQGPKAGSTAMSQNRSCGSYGPGHLVHWIQAKKTHEPGQPIIKVKVVAVHDDGRVDIEGDGLNLTLWNHDAEKLRSAVGVGGSAEWIPKFHVLRMFSAGSFNLATLDRVEPCVPPARRRPTETTRQFIERAMRENHGYTVPQRWLVDLDGIPDGDTGEPESGYLVGTNAPTPEEKALMRKLADEFGHRPTSDDQGVERLRPERPPK